METKTSKGKEIDSEYLRKRKLLCQEEQIQRCRRWRHQRQGNVIHRAESLAAAERWQLNYPQRLRRKRKRYGRLRCLRRDKGRATLFRADLGRGPQGPPYSFKRY